MLEPLFKTLQALTSGTLLKRDTNIGISCEYCEIFQNISERLLLVQESLNHRCHTQSAITCSKLTVETLEPGVKYVQS